jgi:hypothetical protein
MFNNEYVLTVYTARCVYVNTLYEEANLSVEKKRFHLSLPEPEDPLSESLGDEWRVLNWKWRCSMSRIRTGRPNVSLHLQEKIRQVLWISTQIY